MSRAMSINRSTGPMHQRRAVVSAAITSDGNRTIDQKGWETTTSAPTVRVDNKPYAFFWALSTR
jgi:hypothetical protein